MASDDVLKMLKAFTAEREWGQFHSPENLSKSISIEAGELLECFQWSGEFTRSDVELELADVLTYCYLLADALDRYPEDLIREKLAVTKRKYPVDLAKGSAAKYTELGHREAGR